MNDGPYRTARPLNDIIPPDRRKQRAALLVIASMIAGAVLWQITRSVLEPDTPPSPPPMEPPGFRVDKLTSEDIEKVVRMHTIDLRQACWQSRNDAPTTAHVTVSTTIDANGNVTAVSSQSTDPPTARCVEAQVRSWTFPAHREDSKIVDLPFKFARD